MIRRIKDHVRWMFYSVSRIVTGTALTCLTAVRHFNVPDLHHVDGVLLAANHQSFLDPVLVGMAIDRPVHYLARSGLFAPPGFGRLIRGLGAHPLQRGKVDSSALRTAMNILRGGEPLLLFPEGTRTRDGSVGQLRPGAAGLASRCHVPLIPVCIEGAFRAWPRTKLLPHPAPVAVAFGEPMWSEERDGRDLTEAVKEQIIGMQQHLRSFLGGTPVRWSSRHPGGLM
jgi:1-acyl-sn-glycerol-3-phosphate acyltransferase